MPLPAVSEKTAAFGPNAVLLGKGTAVSRLLGFARDALMAALLGGGWLADAFLVALRLPNAVRRLLGEGVLAYALVPLFGGLRRDDAPRAARVFRAMTITLVLLFGLVALAGIPLSGGAVLFLAPGFADRPDVYHTAADLLALCLAYLPLAAGAAVAAAALMAEGRFLRPAFGSAVLNLAVIAAAGAGLLLFGTGDVRAARLLCAGVVLGGAVQWLWQVPELRRAGYPCLGAVHLRDKAVTRTLRALPGSAFGAAGSQGTLVLATMLASFLAEGSVSALYFAERLIELPLGLVGASLSLAALAELEPGAARDNAAFAATLGSAVRFTLFFAMPAAVGLACLATPITALIFGHGGFGGAALERTSAALLAYTVGLPALAVTRPLLAGLGALGDTASPTRAACLGLGGTLVLGGLALSLGAVWGVALGVSLAAWGSGVFLALALARAGVRSLPGPGWLAKLALACCLMAACVIALAGLCSGNSMRVGVGVPVGVAVYFLTGRLLGLAEAATSLRDVAGLARRKGR